MLSPQKEEIKDQPGDKYVNYFDYGDHHNVHIHQNIKLYTSNKYNSYLYLNKTLKKKQNKKTI